MTNNAAPIGRSEIVYFAEPLGGGRAIMRRDVVADGVLVSSELDGSPAPIATVRAHERRYTLGAASDG